MEIYLAKTQGFCSGVTLAITIVEKALGKYGPPLYVFHEIVHNTYVVNNFQERGVIFVEALDAIPKGETVIFSAHGVSPRIISDAQNRQLRIIDATCPLVSKVHREATNYSKQGYEIILIGHKGHQEIVGTSGHIDPSLLHIIEKESDIKDLRIDPHKKVAYITQTTLSCDDVKTIVDQLKERFPPLVSPQRSDICDATQTRQEAVKELARFCDLIIICGSANSSNSNRLVETVRKYNVESFLVDCADEFDLKFLIGKEKVGISSGASVPKIIVEGVIQKIKNQYPETKVHRFENPEDRIVFNLPAI